MKKNRTPIRRRHQNVSLGIFCLILSAKIFGVEVFFSPGSDCEKQIVDSINGAQKEIVAAVYSLNNKNIVESLKRAHQRKVAVRILTNRLQASNRASKTTELWQAKLPIRVHSVHRIEHNKFGVFDEKKAITGSFNWTNAAQNVNSENCVVLTEENAVQAFHNRFEHLWQVNAESQSTPFIKKLISKRASTKVRSTASGSAKE